MSERTEYLVALEIDPVGVDEYHEGLPLHSTIMHWFETDRPSSDVVEVVASVVGHTQPMELIGGAPDYFGLKKNVPVNRVANYEPVLALHKKLYEGLMSINVEHSAPYWTLDGFNAHVSAVEDSLDGVQRLEEGESAWVEQAYVVKALNPEHDLLKIIASVDMAPEDE